MYKIIAKVKKGNEIVDKIIPNNFTTFEEVEDLVINFYNHYDEDEFDVSEIDVSSGYYTWIYIKLENMKFKLIVKELV